MSDQDDSITRRKFIESAGAVVGVATLGVGCGDDAGETPAAGSGGVGAPGAAGRSGATGGASPPASGAGRPAAGGGGRSAVAGSGGGVGAGASAPPIGGADEPDAGSGAPAAGSGGGPASSGKVVVAIVSRPNVEEAVALAVELAGGLGAIQPGQSVFIKVNAVSDRLVGSAGIRTSPEVLSAVVKLVKARNPGRIVVGDRSARQFPDTAGIFERSGLGQAALDAGADEVYAAQSPEDAPEEWMLLQPEGWQTTWMSAGGLLAMKRILEADHLVNVPTCKICSR